MIRLSVTCVVLGVVLLGACQERLSQPSDCPTLCPGTGLTVRDTVIEALQDRDSVFTGYRAATERTALLTSDGLAAGEARTFLVYPRRSDSIVVDGVYMRYTVDSVVFVFTLVGRDTAAKDLRVLLHRISAEFDTASTFAEVDAAMSPATVVDSGVVADTLRSGHALRVRLEGEALDRLAVPEEDSLFGIGVRVRGDRATGLRFSSSVGLAGGPQFATYVRVDVADTARQRQTVVLGSVSDNYVLDAAPPDPAALSVGGPMAARALIRFPVPEVLRDSTNVLRATLELTPLGPLHGLPTDTTRLEVIGVLADVGAKSPVIGSLRTATILPVGGSDLVVSDVRAAVQSWLATDGPPAALFLAVSPEGGSFLRPVFHSSRSGPDRPRIRITYALPTRPGNP
jgi:hypothetical protein